MEDRKRIFDILICFKETSYERFAGEGSPSRQMVSQVLLGKGASAPVLALIDDFIAKNIDELRKFIDRMDGEL